MLGHGSSGGAGDGDEKDKSKEKDGDDGKVFDNKSFTHALSLDHTGEHTFDMMSDVSSGNINIGPHVSSTTTAPGSSASGKDGNKDRVVVEQGGSNPSRWSIYGTATGAT